MTDKLTYQRDCALRIIEQELREIKASNLITPYTRGLRILRRLSIDGTGSESIKNVIKHCTEFPSDAPLLLYTIRRLRERAEVEI